LEGQVHAPPGFLSAFICAVKFTLTGKMIPDPFQGDAGLVRLPRGAFSIDVYQKAVKVFSEYSADY
jgi:hypothetical protein